MSLVLGAGPLGLPTPSAGPEVCGRCHGPARHGSGECWCCLEVGRLLGDAAGDYPRVLVAALCQPGDALHGLLRRYKDGPVVEARRHHAEVLGGLLDRLLRARWAELGGRARCDGVAAVPSSTRAAVAGRLLCPVDALVATTRALADIRPVRLRRGPSPCRHLQPAVDAFVAPDDVAGQRVLVVDDTWVTGARARSAAVALTRAGAEVVGTVVVGRTVSPSCSPGLSAWWARAGGRPLTPGRRVQA